MKAPQSKYKGLISQRGVTTIKKKSLIKFKQVLIQELTRGD